MVNSASLHHALADWLFTGWVKPIEEIRRERLLMLVRHFGSYPALNRALGRSDRDATLNQYVTRAKDSRSGRTRAVGRAVARTIEETLTLPAGWMDLDPEASPAPVAEVLGKRPPISLADARRDRDGPTWPFSTPWGRYQSLDPNQRTALDQIVAATIDGFAPPIPAKSDAG